MGKLLEIVKLIINMILNPINTNSGIIFWVIVLIIAFQYRRIAKNRENLYGIKTRTLFKDVLLATFYGLLGGILGSILLYLTGVSLSEQEIIYLWPIAIILLLFNPRFLCFSYAGGIISLSFLMFNYPVVRVPQLMGLVAILHMVESLLILVSGHLGATPIITKNNTGQLVGGFTLQKFWPIPLAAMLVLGGHTETIPIVAGLGYGDLALARRPEEKSRISAIYLAMFSIILLAFSLMAYRYVFFAWLAALFSPLGHEFIIYLGQHIEYRSKPLYVPSDRGVRVLAVLPGTLAESIGIKTGDIIYEVNGYPVNNKNDLAYIMQLYNPSLEINFVNTKEGLHRKERISFSTYSQLGTVLVPDGSEETYMELKSGGLIRLWWQKMKKRKL